MDPNSRNPKQAIPTSYFKKIQKDYFSPVGRILLFLSELFDVRRGVVGDLLLGDHDGDVDPHTAQHMVHPRPRSHHHPPTYEHTLWGVDL